MKTLKQACIPRANTFDPARRDTMLDLSALIDGQIDPDDFFAENHITEAMKTLLAEGFQRLEGKFVQGVFKLTHAMGGDKTHGLLALGLLAVHSEDRAPVMGEFYAPGRPWPRSSRRLLRSRERRETGGKVNENRLTTATEFQRRELDETPFGQSLARHALYAVWRAAKSADITGSLTWLRTELATYWPLRGSLVTVLQYLAGAKIDHWRKDTERRTCRGWNGRERPMFEGTRKCSIVTFRFQDALCTDSYLSNAAGARKGDHA